MRRGKRGPYSSAGSVRSYGTYSSKKSYGIASNSSKSRSNYSYNSYKYRWYKQHKYDHCMILAIHLIWGVFVRKGLSFFFD